MKPQPKTTNEFKAGTPLKLVHKRPVTAPEVMAATIGRDASEKMKRNPVHVEYAPVSCVTPGLGWITRVFRTR